MTYRDRDLQNTVDYCSTFTVQYLANGFELHHPVAELLQLRDSQALTLAHGLLANLIVGFLEFGGILAEVALESLQPPKERASAIKDNRPTEERSACTPMALSNLVIPKRIGFVVGENQAPCKILQKTRE